MSRSLPAARGPARSWRALVLVATLALVGGIATLAAGAALGMPGKDLSTLGWMLGSAALVTVVAAAIAGPLLARTSMRARFVAVAAIGATVALANLAVLARLMFVNEHDLTLLAVTLLYAAAAGVGAALVIARSSTAALNKLSSTAERLGSGDLRARTGPLDAGPELDMLGSTLDEMAERLETAVERERAVERTRRDLFTAVSHDLRTPLATLQAMVEAIDDGIIDDPPTLRRYVGEMRTGVGALTGLVDDLFELAQLDAGAIEQETHRVTLAVAVESAYAACASQASEKGLDVQIDIAPAADALCSPRLERVVANLLSNAIRLTPSDGSVWVSASRDRDRLEVAVEDAGPGIAPADQEHVFEPFWRADPARTGSAAGAGSGLGLTLAKRITEALGGELHAEEPRTLQGARFAVRVPIPRPAEV